MSNSTGSTSTTVSGPLIAHAVRFEPGDDLVPCLLRTAHDAMRTSGTTACIILTAVGSLSRLTLRMANAQQAGNQNTDSSSSSCCCRTWQECLELTSMVGTFSLQMESSSSSSSSNGEVLKHVHLTVSDAQGNAFGGHLMEGTVHTTLELVLGVIGGISFERHMDERTGYRELVVRKQTGL